MGWSVLGRCVSLASLCIAVLAAPCGAQSLRSMPAPAAPKAAKPALRLPGNAPATVLRLAPVDPAEIEAVRHANATSFVKTLQVGVGRPAAHVPGAGSDALEWIDVAGGRAARWHVSSPGAVALRVGLAAAWLPPAAELRFAGAGEPGTVYGPYTAAQVAAGGVPYWSPVLEGDTAIVEVFSPLLAPMEQVSLAVAHVSHLFANPAEPRAERRAKAGSEFCEVDLACRAPSDPALAQAGRAVARMTYTNNSGGTSLCTGTLLASNDSALPPYFYTAQHCISTQASASSLTTHWFYETTGCGNEIESPSYVQVPGGAALLYADGPSDATLLRLNAPPPPGATFAGWDASTIPTGTPLVGIHHPLGDYKKVSLGRMGGYGGSGDPDKSASYIIVNWNGIATGVVERGSSGSGIFSAAGSPATEYRLRGGLLGGPSSCTAPASQLFDTYSRLDQVFPSIQRYLSPSAPTGAGPNVVANPGFESGPVSWSQSATNGLGVIVQGAQFAHAGSWYALLGGYLSGTDTIEQDVAVPQGSPRLQFWHRISSDEGATSSVFDALTVSVASPSSGATLATLATLSNANASATWSQSAAYDLSAFAGQTVRLRFRAVNDFSNVTSFRIDDVSVASAAAAGGANYTALWWKADESGWGLNVTHQGDIAFATLFTYDDGGRPLWLVMSRGDRQPGTDTFTGTLYRTTGPVFNAVPFTPITAADLTPVGTMSLAFAGAEAGTLAYSVNGRNVTKDITKNVFGSRAAVCQPTQGSRDGATNYQDLWWDADESGWGVNITHQDQTLFATLFTYGADRQPLWLLMSGGPRQGDGSYAGTLYRVTGPAFDARPFTPIGPGNLTPVGTMRFRFSHGGQGTMEYTVDGAPVVKSITRQEFALPLPLCN